MARIDVLFAKPNRLWRTIVVSLPTRFLDTNEWDDGANERLKLFAVNVARRFKLRKPRVRTYTMRRGHFCYLQIYEGEGTRTERRLFKKVFAYVGRHAPKPGRKRRSAS